MINIKIVLEYLKKKIIKKLTTATELDYKRKYIFSSSK